MKISCLYIFSIVFFNCSFSQTIIPLYKDVVPNFKASNVQEKIVLGIDGGERVSNVTIPTLKVFFPKKANGMAVIICPGGGYTRLSITKEGDNVAKLLNEQGITAFVLKYRLPNDTIMFNKEVVPFQDAQRAIQLVRSQASVWKIDSSKIGLMGFSAGGHLSAFVGTHFDTSFLNDNKKISLRPDFLVLIYPAISLMDTLTTSTQKKARNRLFSDSISIEKLRFYSSELHVNATTPPTFIVHAKDDEVVKVENSIAFYNALLKNNVSAEMHLYQKGGHGFGLINPIDTSRWTDWLKLWLKKL